MNPFARTELMLGKDAMRKLDAAKVAVFGIGGVGGYAVEALTRSGVGRLDLFDDDKICITNINRQILATSKTIGKYKVDVARERILDINPDATVNAHRLFFLLETSSQVDLSQYDYIVDAIDTVSGKIELVVKAHESGTPIISSMGAGNKLDAAGFIVADIYETSVCPLAKVMRHELRGRGIPHLKVVYSKEKPLPPKESEQASCRKNCVCTPDDGSNVSKRRQIPGSIAFVPAVAGLIIAGEVVRDLVYPRDKV